MQEGPQLWWSVLVNGGPHKAAWMSPRPFCMFQRSYSQGDGKMSPNIVVKMHEIVVLPSGAEAGITEEV